MAKNSFRLDNFREAEAVFEAAKAASVAQWSLLRPNSGSDGFLVKEHCHNDTLNVYGRRAYAFWLAFPSLQLGEK